MGPDETYELADNLDRDAHRAEDARMGHECGHQFTISVTSLGHYGLADQGPESHEDAKANPEPVHFTRTVRAHNLASALRRAAQGGLVAWDTHLSNDEPGGE